MKMLLLLEDNQSLGHSLRERLLQEGYEVTWARSLEEGRAAMQGLAPDLAIVDVSLPDGSGFEFARTVLQPQRTPIVFLSAFSSAEYRLEGYELGAAEYIPKPFHLRELLLRIKRVLEAGKSLRMLEVGPYTINLTDRTIVDHSGAPVPLPAKDLELLCLLIESTPKVVSRAEILERLWGGDSSASSRTIDNMIVRLRQLFGSEGADRIRSVRGVGYQWVPQ
ncbi:MAG: DNA-binding response regulator [Proteobacteria bacterium]|nr:DNA-binding response regulator [Pseudomonadota bacterium]